MKQHSVASYFKVLPILFGCDKEDK